MHVFAHCTVALLFIALILFNFSFYICSFVHMCSFDMFCFVLCIVNKLSFVFYRNPHVCFSLGLGLNFNLGSADADEYPCVGLL